MLSNVDLPQPDGPSRQTNSPSLTRQVHVRQRFDLPAMPTEDFADPLDINEGRAVRRRSTAAGPATVPGPGSGPGTEPL